MRVIKKYFSCGFSKMQSSHCNAAFLEVFISRTLANLKIIKFLSQAFRKKISSPHVVTSLVFLIFCQVPLYTFNDWVYNTDVQLVVQQERKFCKDLSILIIYYAHRTTDELFWCVTLISNSFIVPLIFCFAFFTIDLELSRSSNRALNDVRNRQLSETSL